MTTAPTVTPTTRQPDLIRQDVDFLEGFGLCRCNGYSYTVTAEAPEAIQTFRPAALDLKLVH